jgi:hypothetical protein
MKKIRNSILALMILLFVVPVLGAQELSKYRNFSIGAKLPTVLKLTDQKFEDVSNTHGNSFQELTWWPSSAPGKPLSSNSVQQILFSFYNGELYRIAVTYDQTSTEGLTADDMVTSVSAKYGPPRIVAPAVEASTSSRYEEKERSVATWEDSQYSFNLVRSSFTDGFGLVIYSKRTNAEAELAIAEAVKLDKQEGPQREAERQKKQTEDLEAMRQKNRKIFRP